MGISPSRPEPIGDRLGMLERLAIAVSFQFGLKACAQGIDRLPGRRFVWYGGDLCHLGIRFGIKHGSQYDARVIEDGFWVHSHFICALAKLLERHSRNSAHVQMFRPL